MGLLIAFAVLSIGVSFICSILEAALLSLTPSYIAHQKESQPQLYEKLKTLKDNIDRPLAAILTLNTVAHTVGAAGVGAQATVVFGSGYLGIVSAVMTVLILVLSEIVPKTVGARYWPSLARFLPGCLNAMILVLKPFIWLSDMIMKLIGGKAPDHNLRQEIKALTVLGRELNKLNNNEQRVIANVLDLHDIKTCDIMTPRIVCETVGPDEDLQNFAERVKAGQFSRYPVLAQDESPLGVVFRHDMLAIADQKTVAELMRPVKVVSDKLSVEDLMALLINERQHMCLVYDEYGTWMGLATLEDVLETIIGKPIVDETDDIPNMRRLARKRWEHRLNTVYDNE
ncbi:MAG TPA: CNNM domain-containing protein [Marinagarivorans sp.]